MEDDEPTWPRPTIRRTSRPCGCWAKSCRRFRWWRPSRPAFTTRFPIATASTPCRTTGPSSITSSAGAFTAPAIATSPAHGRAARPRRSADHLLPPGRLQLAVRDSRRPERGHVDGHEPAVGLAAQQPRRRFRSVRLARDHASTPASRWTKCSTIWPSASGLLGLSGISGDVRDLEEAARPRATPAHAWRSTCSSSAIRHYLGADAGRAGRRRRDRVHRRHRRERRQHSRRGVRATWKSSASCSIRRPTPRPRANAKISAADSRMQMWVVPTNEELIVARQTKQLLEGKG